MIKCCYSGKSLRHTTPPPRHRATAKAKSQYCRPKQKQELLGILKEKERD